MAGGGFARRTEQRERRQTRQRVVPRTHGLSGEDGAIEAVLGGEQRDEARSQRAAQDDAVGFPGGVGAGLVGDEADVLAAHGGEAGVAQGVDAQAHLRVCGERQQIGQQATQGGNTRGWHGKHWARVCPVRASDNCRSGCVKSDHEDGCLHS